MVDPPYGTDGASVEILATGGGGPLTVMVVNFVLLPPGPSHLSV